MLWFVVALHACGHLQALRVGPWSGLAQLRPSCICLGCCICGQHVPVLRSAYAAGVASVGSMFPYCGVHMPRVLHLWAACSRIAECMMLLPFVAVQVGCSDGDLHCSQEYAVQGLWNAF